MSRRVPPEALKAALAGQPKYAGAFCDVFYGERTERDLAAVYARPRLCLKRVLGATSIWEGAPLTDVCEVQNLAAIRGLAPRIYDVIDLPGGDEAMVTDWMPPGGEPTPTDLGALCEFIHEFGIKTHKRVNRAGTMKWDLTTSVCNWHADKFLDWGGFVLGHRDGCIESIRQHLMFEIAGANRGEPTSHTYQPLPQLGIAGNRDTVHRIQAMRLGEIDFAGKTVLDLGCNLGAFSFYADDRGAARVVGVDIPQITWPLADAAVMLHYWNVDLVGLRLPRELNLLSQETGIDRFDVVFALSICNHVGGYASWIADLVKPGGMLVLEGHGGDSVGKYEAGLARDFERHELIGYTEDVYRRPVFWCWKANE